MPATITPQGVTINLREPTPDEVRKLGRPPVGAPPKPPAPVGGLGEPTLPRGTRVGAADAQALGVDLTPVPSGPIQVREPTPEEQTRLSALGLQPPPTVPGPNLVGAARRLPTASDLLWGAAELAATVAAPGAVGASRLLPRMLASGGMQAAFHGLTKENPTPGDVAGAAVAGAAGEAAAPVLSATWRGLKSLPVRAIAKKMAKGADEVGQAAIEMTGGRVLPNQTGTDSNLLSVLSSMAANSPLARGRWQKAVREAEDALVRRVESEIGQFGPRATRESAGGVLREAGIDAAAREGLASTATAVRRGQESIDLAKAGLAQAEQDALTAEAGVIGALNRLTSRYGEGGRLEEAGRQGQRIVEAAHDAAKRAASAMYDEVDELGAGVRVSLQPLQDFAREEAERRGGLALALTGGKPATMLKATAAEGAEDTAVAEGREILGKLTPGGPQETFMNALAEAGVDLESAAAGQVTFRQAHEIRAALGRVIRNAERSTDANAGQAAGLAKQLFARIDQSMTDAAGVDTPLAQAYTAATAAWKEMSQRFEEGVLAKAVEAHPAQAVKAFLGPSGSVADIQQAKAVLGEAGWRPIQAEVWRGLVQHPDGTAKTTKEFLTSLRKIPTAQLHAIFEGGAADIAQIGPAMVSRDAARAGVTTAQKGLTEAASQAATAANQAMTRSNTAVAKAQAANPYTLVAESLDRASGTDIAKLRTVVGDEGWKQVQSLKLQEIFGREGGAEALASGAKMVAKLPPDEQLTKIFDPGTVSFLHTFARVRERLTETAKAKGPGSMWIQMVTPGAVGGLIGGIVAGSAMTAASAGGILLTPYVFSRIATSPTLRRTLLKGMKETSEETAGKLATGTAARTAAQLAGMLIREGIVDAPGAPPSPTPTGPTGQSGRGGGPGPRASQGPPIPPPPVIRR